MPETTIPVGENCYKKYFIVCSRIRKFKIGMAETLSNSNRFFNFLHILHVLFFYLFPKLQKMSAFIYLTLSKICLIELSSTVPEKIELKNISYGGISIIFEAASLPDVWAQIIPCYRES